MALIGRFYQGAWIYKILTADHTPNSESEKDRLASQGVRFSAVPGSRCSSQQLELPSSA